ncbi:Viral membrane formation [Sea otter poxvirus]|uniref:Viral membrane formation n=1 Tax=Sea otter poxvirus TaxID=1416741 RepID=A0A2U9QHS0_9POXV|nr:Viral membrane formation [Sea otter poxvirus]AWU47145.1 Viral membrane formation [Sea otter poxvirus]
MTTVPVTDIPSEYIATTFSEDNYPSNKNYELTAGQLSIMRTVHDTLLKGRIRSESVSSDDDASPTPCSDMEEENDNIIAPPNNSMAITIPSTSTIAKTMPKPITTQQETAIRSINILKPVSSSNEQYIFASEQKRFNITTVSELDTVIENEPVDRFSHIQSIHHTTPSLGSVFDDNKRVKLLEQEVKQLRKQQSGSPSNLENFTKILFGKTPLKATEVNKRMVIVNYANLNDVTLNIEDLNDCSDEEIERMFKTIKQYNEVRKRKIIVTNMIIISITIFEQILVRLGFEDIKGLSSDVTSEIIDIEIGDDCEVIANKIGFGSNPVFNIMLFIVKLFVKKMKII